MSLATLTFLLFTATTGGLAEPGAVAEPAKTSEKGPSDSLLTFMFIINGVFTDVYQVLKDWNPHVTRPHDPITFTFRPVHVPALDKEYTFLFEDTLKGKVVRLQILSVEEESNGHIKITPYNFTDITKMTSGTFDLNDLQTLTLNDLDTRPECVIHALRVEKTVFMGSWPDCRSEPKGRVPLDYQNVYSCNAHSGFSTPVSAEATTTYPYVFSKTAVRFPWPPNMLSVLGDLPDPCATCGEN